MIPFPAGRRPARLAAAHRTAALLLPALSLVLMGVPAALAVDYHIDSVLGDDGTGDGSLGAPWGTLSMLGTVTLSPGDRVRLARGSLFRERLNIDASGAPGSPIIVEAYGAGRDPIVSGGEIIPQGTIWTDVGGEYRLLLGNTTEYYYGAAALVRGQPTGFDTYVLLDKGDLGSLLEDEFILVFENLTDAVLYYRPPAGQVPGDFEFEISKRNSAIRAIGDWVEIRDIIAVLGNHGHSMKDPPVVQGNIVVEGQNGLVSGCRVAYGTTFGLDVLGADTRIENCLAEYNLSSGMSVSFDQATGSVLEENTVRYNGNLRAGAGLELDRGGIAVHSDYVTVRDNVIHDNGDVRDNVGPREGGDDAIVVIEAHDVLIENNLIVNSLRGAVGMSETADTYGIRVIGNVIVNWNLVDLSGMEATKRTQAINLLGCGQTPQSGLFTVWNNTLYSDQVDTTIIGIQLAVASSSDSIRDSSVKNNIIYMPNNTKADSFGMRFTRGHLFYDVEIDHNDVYLPLAPIPRTYYWFANQDPIVFETAAEFAANVIFCAGDPECVPVPGYESSGLNIDPLLALSSPDPLDAANFDLTAASPAIDAGTPVGLIRDYAGRRIPRRAGPDMGAFEAPWDADGDGVFDPDDNCPVDSNLAQLDDDLDGEGDACDCAPFDPSGREPEEVMDLTAAYGGGSLVQLSWSATTAADTYAVTRVSLGSLAPGDYGVCLGVAIAVTSFDDGGALAAGDGVGYLVQGENLLCGSGTLGLDSQAIQRLNSNPAACP